jgi:glycine/D-amino acid oxidase-like deaminating enzyme
MPGRRNVLIVGAGIIGASVAWHLARAGARVTIVEAGEPGGIATGNSWAWINASWGNPESYFRLRIRAMDEWRRLERELPEIRVAWVGGLLWELPPGQLEAFAAEHTAWGYDLRRVDAVEAQRIEPRLAAPPDFALHAPGEGAVEPQAAAQTLLAAARSLGATVIANTAVRSINLRAGRVIGVETQSGAIVADQVVIAAGAGTPTLAARVGLALPIAALPALLVVTKPHRKLLNGLVMPPGVQVRQTTEGRLVATASFDGTNPGADPALAANDLLHAMRGLLRGSGALALESHAIGHRPIPADGLPIVGGSDAIDGLYLSVMHSGITLAAAVGRFLAEEVMTGRRHPLLASYGPGRLLARRRQQPT